MEAPVGALARTLMMALIGAWPGTCIWQFLGYHSAPGVGLSRRLVAKLLYWVLFCLQGEHASLPRGQRRFAPPYIGTA